MRAPQSPGRTVLPRCEPPPDGNRCSMKRKMAAPIRVGVRIPGKSVPRWVAGVLEELAASATVELALVLVDRRTGPRRRRGGAAFRLYEALDRWHYRDADDPFGLVGSPVPGDVPELELERVDEAL